MSLLLPRMLRLRQTFDSPKLNDVPGEVERQLASLPLRDKIRPKESVAVTVGSRGIMGIATITRAIVAHLKGIGALPFIVPAMGSHGGATSEGQRALIEGFGVTEEFIGCEIRSSMETVIVAKTPQGIPVHFDKNAWSADHVLVAGRVKPHTGFVGEIESGLHKMMLIGLGKSAGACIYHKAIKDFSFMEIIRAVADVVLRDCKVVGGLAILENALDETALIEAVPPNLFFEREQELLKMATAWLPRLPISDIDLLIVDQIGKNISGTGMDTNVVGRKYNDHAATEKDGVRCRRIFVRGLTEATHGNACGIGLCEFVNRRTVEAMDTASTYVNCITAGHPGAAMIPMTYETDREAIEAALQTCGLTPPQDARVVQISDTLHLQEVSISESCLPLLAGRTDIELLGPLLPMSFDSSGNLQPI